MIIFTVRDKFIHLVFNEYRILHLYIKFKKNTELIAHRHEQVEYSYNELLISDFKKPDKTSYFVTFIETEIINELEIIFIIYYDSVYIHLSITTSNF